jgi:hypothetical protein
MQPKSKFLGNSAGKVYVARVKHVIHTDLTDAAEDMRMRNVSTRLYEGSIKRGSMKAPLNAAL